MWLLRFVLRSVVVLVSLTIGVASGLLVLSYAVPAPVLFEGGGREGTPVQILGFVVPFLVVSSVVVTLGQHHLEIQFQRRGW
jgi:hypothetical protein